MPLVLADVSEFQGVIDWASYGAVNPAVIVRVHNSGRPDNRAQPNIAGARRYCAWRGWYQYLTAGADPVKAAHDFQATLGPTLPGEAMILDLEEGAGDQRARRAAWINALQDPVEWTYSGLSFARAHLAGTRVEWLAAYGQGEPTDAHTIWQFTNARRFAGITNPADGSLFPGTLAQLKALTTTPKEPDMPLTSAEIDAIATRTARELLGTMLGSSGPTVAVALQRGGAPLVVDVVAIAKAVSEAVPAGAPGAPAAPISRADLESALRAVLGSVDGK